MALFLQNPCGADPLVRALVRAGSPWTRCLPDVPGAHPAPTQPVLFAYNILFNVHDAGLSRRILNAARVRLLQGVLTCVPIIR
jgi:hypothetical protein